jgi:hypothetical protein
MKILSVITGSEPIEKILPRIAHAPSPLTSAIRVW